MGVWSAGAVVTALIELSVRGELRSSGLNCSAPVSELSIRYVIARAGREQFFHKAGLGLLARWENSALLLFDLLHRQDCALQP